MHNFIGFPVNFGNYAFQTDWLSETLFEKCGMASLDIRFYDIESNLYVWSNWFVYSVLSISVSIAIAYIFSILKLIKSHYTAFDFQNNNK